jgi:hypothetical protein
MAMTKNQIADMIEDSFEGTLVRFLSDNVIKLHYDLKWGNRKKRTIVIGIDSSFKYESKEKLLVRIEKILEEYKEEKYDESNIEWL